MYIRDAVNWSPQTRPKKVNSVKKKGLCGFAAPRKSKKYGKNHQLLSPEISGQKKHVGSTIGPTHVGDIRPFLAYEPIWDTDQAPGMLMNIKIAGWIFVPSKFAIGGIGFDPSCRHVCCWNPYPCGPCSFANAILITSKSQIWLNSPLGFHSWGPTPTAWWFQPFWKRSISKISIIHNSSQNRMFFEPHLFGPPTSSPAPCRSRSLPSPQRPRWPSPQSWPSRPSSLQCRGHRCWQRHRRRWPRRRGRRRSWDFRWFWDGGTMENWRFTRV